MFWVRVSKVFTDCKRTGGPVPLLLQSDFLTLTLIIQIHYLLYYLLAPFLGERQFQRLRLGMSKLDHQNIVLLFLNILHIILGSKIDGPAVIEIGLSGLLLNIIGGARVADDRNRK